MRNIRTVINFLVEHPEVRRTVLTKQAKRLPTLNQIPATFSHRSFPRNPHCRRRDTRSPMKRSNRFRRPMDLFLSNWSRRTDREQFLVLCAPPSAENEDITSAAPTANCSRRGLLRQSPYLDRHVHTRRPVVVVLRLCKGERWKQPVTPASAAVIEWDWIDA